VVGVRKFWIVKHESDEKENLLKKKGILLGF